MQGLCIGLSRTCFINLYEHLLFTHVYRFFFILLETLLHLWQNIHITQWCTRKLSIQNLLSRDVKIVFSWKSIIVCWKSIFSQLSFPDVKVTVGCSNILGCCTVRSDEAAAVKAGSGEAGLQRRRLNRPALHTASNSNILSCEMKLCRLVNRLSLIHISEPTRPY